MKRPFLRRMAEDLLTLEINTIVKADMSAIKMPSSSRQTLHALARDYHTKLVELKARRPINWKYAGMRSFGELRDRAKAGIEKYERERGRASEARKEVIQQDIKMLERIRDQSSNIVNLFKDLRQSVEDKIEKSEKDFHDVPGTIKGEVSQADSKEPGEGRSGPAEPHTDSQGWNNDITREQMNKVDDLDLTAEQVTLIRKAWEIGTERIELQTVIQIDGDVTTRLPKRFLRNPNDMLLRIHNDSVETSTRFWSNLVKTLVDAAGKTLEVILGVGK
jgi:hypothetical protein